MRGFFLANYQYKMSQPETGDVDMKRSFLVLILIFIAAPAAYAGPGSCPCFHDLQVAGTCSNTPSYYAIQAPSSGPLSYSLWCSSYDPADDDNPPGPMATGWRFSADPNYDGRFVCTAARQTITPGTIEIRKNRSHFTASEWMTQAEYEDCVVQLESAAEILGINPNPDQR